MALITRVSRLFTADVHAVLDRIEEPEVVLKQAIREMTEEIARDEQQQRWLETEREQLVQIATDCGDSIASLDSELDLCFEAGEDDLARSLVKRKLSTEQKHKQAATQLEVVNRSQKALEATLSEQRQMLAEMQQKADLLMDAPCTGAAAVSDAVVSQDAIDVAFLREKRSREERTRKETGGQS